MYLRISAFLTVVVVLRAPLCAREVVGFTLIDASTDKEIRPFRDGDTINFETEGTALNIRADVRGNVDSVRFELNSGQGTEMETETAPPYSIGGDRRGDYDAWMPSPEEYRLTVVVFADGSGVRGKAGTITFTVVGTPKRAPLRPSQPSSPSPVQVLETNVELGAIPAPVGGGLLPKNPSSLCERIAEDRGICFERNPLMKKK
jgi:hypothetical protein